MDEKRLRIKIGTAHEIDIADGRQPIGPETKRMSSWDEYKSPAIQILGVPFGGPVEGRDLDGEAFHSETDIWVQAGDTVPVTYYHGFGPDDPAEWQETPAVIGRAMLRARDERGFWFEARLDPEEPLAQRVLAALADDQPVRASTGAIAHLVRMGQADLIDIWPVGELAIFDTNDWRLPANDFAVVSWAAPAEETTPEAEPEAVEAKGKAVERFPGLVLRRNGKNVLRLRR